MRPAPISALESFRHLIDTPRVGPLADDRQGLDEIPKFIRARNRDTMRLARGMRCANPKCPHKKLDIYSYLQLQGMGGADPHHITTRGAGGGDERENLCPLCRGCHDAAHRHEFTQQQLREWAAAVWAKVISLEAKP